METLAERKSCSNCGQDVPAQNYATHEIFCVRHNSRCAKCGVVVKKSELAEHEETAHKLCICDCGLELEESKMTKHVQEDCVLRPISCPICSLDVEAHEFENHTEYCGNRTEECPECHRFIKLKDFEVHTDTKCAYPEPPKAAPPPSTEDRLDQIRAFTLGDFFPSDSGTIPERRTYRDTPVSPSSLMDSIMCCPVCSAPFQDYTILEQHFQNVHRVKDRSAYDTSSFSRVELAPIKHDVVATCPFCNMTFSEEEDCLVHITTTHDSDLGNIQPTSRPSRQASHVTDYGGNEGDVIPCDICHKSIVVADYQEHHAQCTADMIEQESRMHRNHANIMRVAPSHQHLRNPQAGQKNEMHSIRNETRRAASSNQQTQSLPSRATEKISARERTTITRPTSGRSPSTSIQNSRQTTQQRSTVGGSTQSYTGTRPVHSDSSQNAHRSHVTSSPFAISLDSDDEILPDVETAGSTDPSVMSSRPTQSGGIKPSRTGTDSSSRGPTRGATAQRRSTVSQTQPVILGDQLSTRSRTTRPSLINPNQSAPVAQSSLTRRSENRQPFSHTIQQPTRSSRTETEATDSLGVRGVQRGNPATRTTPHKQRTLR